ncbi:L-threonine 3-dehydrogenase [Corynebacterium capitovis DSM 44611]|uniref:alcohol dehydrogenase catalytic domain-containing protein n=1 Tax=Corynebacterium capitovis TaxID=131081 RepID=UPI000374EB62|nr:alcohol dehydrogenase catalytic domain-containing protein [Corynebacterium capitovis]WKD57921.1 L-threonine 3-dehydrogenase [Corynebacterium capitovis DSM 44611]
MKAVRLYGPEDLRIDDVEEPGAPEPGWVTLDIGWAGICGSDLHLYQDGPQFPITPAEGKPHPVTGAELPFTLGHEFSGTVTAVGDGVKELSEGDRVAVMAGVSCGECVACAAGKSNICRKVWGLGLSGAGGGLSAAVNVPAHVAVPVGNMPLEHAAMIEPLSVATHAVRLAGVKKGDIVVIAGAGPIGVFVSAVVTARGARVIISEPNAARLKMALDTGVAEIGLNPMEEDLEEKVREISQGRFADVAFDCAGALPVIRPLAATLHPGGTLQLVAIPSKPLEFDVLSQLHLTEIRVQGSYGYTREDYDESIEKVRSGAIDLAPYVSAKIAPADIVEKGFAALLDRAGTAMKILVAPER